jgi:hypothetical protein
MANYMLICVDTVDGDGRVEPAFKTVIARLAAAYWPLYKRTANSRNIAVGDRVVVYAGGQRAWGLSFHATATINDKLASSRAMDRKLSGLEGQGLPDQWLKLSDIRRLDPCVPIAELLSELSFIPKNQSRWGVALMSGSRRISDTDWNLILGYRPPNSPRA